MDEFHTKFHLQTNSFIKHHKPVVLALNELFKYSFEKKQKIIIVNTSDRNEIEGPGKIEHWILFFWNYNKQCIFYDSYGLHPVIYIGPQLINKIINQDFSYNSIRVQNEKSDKCGYFVLYTASTLCRGLTMEESRVRFDENDSRNRNDAIVLSLFQKEFFYLEPLIPKKLLPQCKNHPQ